jgi:Ca2+-binding RTX toxin-like protein
VAQAIAPWGTTLTIFGPVANLIGTNYNDVLRGNAATNIIRGLGGDDRLFAGTGSAVLVGGAGHNVLRGGPGKNVLIAGLGSSTVVGGSGPSILIGGYTNVDANDQALLALLAQGPQAAVRNGRIAYARSGRRITSALPAGIKVLSTGAHDALFAGSGFTWFLTAGNSSINQSAPLGSAGSLSLSATRLGQGSTKVASVPTTTAAAPTVAVPQPSSLTPLQRAALSRRMLGR